MLPFRLRNDAKQWFRDIREEFKTDFDSFYFCFMASVLVNGRKADIPNSDTAELVNYFPDRFRTRGRLLVAVFLTQELRLLGVEMKDKAAVHRAISALISPESPSYLSEYGVREFNKYAHGGYEVLLEWFPEDRPRTVDAFLRYYYERAIGSTIPF